MYQVNDLFENSLDACCAFYAAKEIPWEIGVSDQHYSVLNHILLQHEFLEIESGVAMALDLKNWHAPNTVLSLEIKDMRDALDAWGIPVALGFESTTEEIKPYIARHQVASKDKDNDTVMHFSGSLENKAICSLTLTRFGDNVRVDDMATIPEYQHKGYATQLLLTALKHAKSQGSRYCFLEASNTGLRLYEKVGFQSLFKNHYFQLKD